MRSLPLGASAYILLIFSIGVLLAVASVITLVETPVLILTVLLLATLIAILDLYPVHLSPGETEFTVSTAVEIAAVLLFSTPVVIAAVNFGTVLAELRVRRVYYKKLFNVGALTIHFAVLSWIYQLVHMPSTGIAESTQDVVALVVLALGNMLVSPLLLNLAISLATRSSPRFIWSEYIGPAMWIDLSQVPVGIFLAVMYRVSPFSAFFMAIPLFALRHAYEAINTLRRQTLEALMALARILEERDEKTHEHSGLVARNAENIARVLGMPKGEIDILVRAAYLHDIGKIGMSNEILYKPSALTSGEREQAQQHVVVGSDLLRKFPAFDLGSLYVRHHHEHWDGSGYPDGLKGEAIPLGARIIAVADAFQAMTEDRPYRRAISEMAALQEIYDHAGTQFDPQVVLALFRSTGHPLPAAIPLRESERVLSGTQVSS